MNSEKKLKLMISSLKDRELVKFFEGYINCFSSAFSKSIRQISFNCYESVCEFRSKVVNGYGKNSSQAFINGVRNLIDLLLEDEKNQSVMKDCLRKMHGNFDSQKKLLSTEKNIKTVGDSKQDKSSLAMSTNFNYAKKPEKDKSIKQQIFEYLNLENLKISNPNISHKTKPHEKYLNHSVMENDEEQLRLTLEKIAQIQNAFSQAAAENKKLREKLSQYYQKDKENRPSGIPEKSHPSANAPKAHQNIPTEASAKINNYMNYSSTNTTTGEPDKVKMRSTSVDPAQKYYTPYSNSHTQQSSQQIPKKLKIPKLNLQVLPNYHGKSNKSLNQSLLEVYEKSKK